jgi:hypothetical protein
MSTIPAERLREGQQILVQGNVSFSRLAALVEGEALANSVIQAKARGALYPTTVPHTTINLVNAVVVPATAGVLTPEEQFVQEKLHTVKSGDNVGKLAFNIDNKSSYLPTVLEPDPEHEGQYRQLVLERDLAGGILVTIVLEVFKPKSYEKRGLGLQQVVLNEPVRYFSSGVDTQALAARGIVVNGGVRAVAASEAAAAGTPIAGDPSVVAPANSGVDVNGFAVPTPGAQGVVPTPSYATQAFPVSAPVAQVAAPVAAPAAPVVQAAAPVAQMTPVETNEQIIARLQQQLAESTAAAAGSGGGSPFDTAPAQVPVLAGAGVGPWDVPGQGAPAYQG